MPRCARCCEDFSIDPRDLFDFDRLPPAGREFVEAHGVTDLSVEERVALLATAGPSLLPGQFTIVHRCQHLDEANQCDIYETRPEICRDFVCSTRNDCALPVDVQPIRLARREEDNP